MPELKLFEVTRKWYVYAKSTTDAIEKTKEISHDEVESKRRTCEVCKR